MECTKSHRDFNSRDMTYSVDEHGAYTASCKHCDYVINIPDPIATLLAWSVFKQRELNMESR